MSRYMISSDWHLGQANIIKYRPQFKTVEEHDSFVLDSMCSDIKEGDTLILLGDIAFTKEALDKVKAIRCTKKILVMGNHCTDHKLTVRDYLEVFDEIHSVYSKRNVWFTHIPIHLSQMRGKYANIHGHDHSGEFKQPDYFNVCPEVNNYKPVAFEVISKRLDIQKKYYYRD